MVLLRRIEWNIQIFDFVSMLCAITFDPRSSCQKMFYKNQITHYMRKIAQVYIKLTVFYYIKLKFEFKILKNFVKILKNCV